MLSDQPKKRSGGRGRKYLASDEDDDEEQVELVPMPPETDDHHPPPPRNSRIRDGWDAAGDHAAGATGCVAKTVMRPVVIVVIVVLVVAVIVALVLSGLVFGVLGWTPDDVKQMVMKAIPSSISGSGGSASLVRYRIISPSAVPVNPWTTQVSPALVGWLDLGGCSGSLAWNVTWTGLSNVGNVALMVRSRDERGGVVLVGLAVTPAAGYQLLSTGAAAACNAAKAALANGDALYFGAFLGAPPASQPTLLLAGLVTA